MDISGPNLPDFCNMFELPDFYLKSYPVYKLMMQETGVNFLGGFNEHILKLLDAHK